MIWDIVEAIGMDAPGAAPTFDGPRPYSKAYTATWPHSLGHHTQPAGIRSEGSLDQKHATTFTSETPKRRENGKVESLARMKPA